MNLLGVLYMPRSASMIMKLIVIACVLVSSSSAHASATAASIAVAGGGVNCQPGANCNKDINSAGWPRVERQPTGGAQERATGDSDGSSRKKTTEFAGWWRGLKHPTGVDSGSLQKRATGDRESGRPTGIGENENTKNGGCIIITTKLLLSNAVDASEAPEYHQTSIQILLADMRESGGKHEMSLA